MSPAESAKTAAAYLFERVEALALKSEGLESERADIRAAAQQLLRSERGLSKGVLDFLLRCSQ